MMYPNLKNLGFHVLDKAYEIIAILKTPEDAAMLVSCLGDGYRIQRNGKDVWIEGEELQRAGESYDNVAKIVYERITT